MHPSLASLYIKLRPFSIREKSTDAPSFVSKSPRINLFSFFLFLKNTKKPATGDCGVKCSPRSQKVQNVLKMIHGVRQKKTFNECECE